MGATRSAILSPHYNHADRKVIVAKDPTCTVFAEYRICVVPGDSSHHCEPGTMVPRLEAVPLSRTLWASQSTVRTSVTASEIANCTYCPVAAFWSCGLSTGPVMAMTGRVGKLPLLTAFTTPLVPEVPQANGQTHGHGAPPAETDTE